MFIIHFNNVHPKFQAVSIGCGKIGTSGPYHNSTKHADMCDAFAWFIKNGKEISGRIKNGNYFNEVTNDNETRIMPSIRSLNGYEITEHSKKYDITKEWKNLTINAPQLFFYFYIGECLAAKGQLWGVGGLP
jgi:hypothetical protein